MDHYPGLLCHIKDLAAISRSTALNLRTLFCPIASCENGFPLLFQQYWRSRDIIKLAWLRRSQCFRELRSRRAPESNASSKTRIRLVALLCTLVVSIRVHIFLALGQTLRARRKRHLSLGCNRNLKIRSNSCTFRLHLVPADLLFLHANPYRLSAIANGTSNRLPEHRAPDAIEKGNLAAATPGDTKPQRSLPATA